MQRSLSFALRIRNLAVPFTPLGATLAMDNNHHHQRRTANSSVESNPAVQKLQQLVNTNPSAGWEESWKQGVIPWDLGRPTPVILHLRDTGSLPMGRALVPGCGTGYDVVAMACPGRYVVGLDISEEGIKKAKQMSSSSPNADYFTFLKEDFFSWRPTDLFDLIFDYTFFCAIEPSMRSAWARQIQNLLKPDGELITLMFPMDDHAGGPPYKVAIEDYEEVLHPMGFKAISIVDNELAVEARKVKRMEDGGGKGKMDFVKTCQLARFSHFLGRCRTNVVPIKKREAWKMEKSCRQLPPMNCDDFRWLIEQPCEGVLELKIKGN